MRLSSAMRLISVSLACCIAFVGLAIAQEKEPESDEQFVKLVQLWNRQRSEIDKGTFRFKGNRMNTNVELSSAEASAAAIALGNKQNEEGLREFSGRINPNAEGKPQFPGFTTLTLQLDGDMVRTFTDQEMRAGDSPLRTTTLHDGDRTYFYNERANQVSVQTGRSGGGILLDAAELRYIPPKALATLKRTSAVLANGRMRFVFDGLHKIECDPKTGFVFYAAIKSNDKKTGLEIHQFSPVVHPGNVVMPTTFVRMRFSDGALGRVEVGVIEAAQPNVAPPAGTFDLFVPGGTKIFDKTDGVGGTISFRSPDAAPDVRSQIDQERLRLGK